MASFRSSVCICLVGLAAAAGCRAQGSSAADSGESAPSLSAADQTGIRAADSAFMAAANAGDADRIAQVYAEDGSLLAPNLPPQKGRDAIRAFWGGFLDAYTVRFEVASDTIEGRGDLAYNQGHYRFTAVPKAKGVPGIADEGKFLEILKKQGDGSWKYVVDMYSSNLAPQH
ncbi:MAG TPA: SgcJ/EcaC family oxidoreductase [Gemmatimonadales bacterium]|nr:SgcJ/EcaC family oxidoreductase [Gemmatimonadales bacterium]